MRNRSDKTRQNLFCTIKKRSASPCVCVCVCVCLCVCVCVCVRGYILSSFFFRTPAVNSVSFSPFLFQTGSPIPSALRATRLKSLIYTGTTVARHTHEVQGLVSLEADLRAKQASLTNERKPDSLLDTRSFRWKAGQRDESQ